MRSFLAALRTLVLPYGATSGARIILDGTVGEIRAEGSEGTVLLSVSGGQPALDFLDPSGSLQASILYDNNSSAWFFQGPVSGLYLDPLGWFAEDTNANNGVRIDATTGCLYSGSRAEKNDWTPLTYQNGWATRSGFFDLAYKFMPDGFVQLRGTCAPGTPNTVIATLPADVVPPLAVSFPAAHDAVTAGQSARVSIRPDGTIMSFGMASAGTTFSLDQCKWSLI
jgi:hypothetical protein